MAVNMKPHLFHLDEKSVRGLDRMAKAISKKDGKRPNRSKAVRTLIAENDKGEFRASNLVQCAGSETEN